MKNKFGKILILLAVLIFAIAAFTACGETGDIDDDDDHVHTYSTEWEHDANSHWHKATCGHDVLGDEGSHSFTNGECVCGYKADLTTWKRDEKTHWHDAEDNGVAIRVDEGAHNLINNECECGLKIEFRSRIYVDTFRIVGLTGDELPVGAHLTVPEKISGCPVVEISAAAFEGQKNLASVTIPDTVTVIKDAAFRGCSSLTEISLKNVPVIASAVFEDCNSLKKIELSPVTTEVNSFAFDSCSSLTDLELPASVTKFGEQVFAGCTSLKSFAIPDGTTVIGRNTFLNCKSLESVTIPATVTKIEAQAFARCTSLKEIELPANLSFIGMSAFRGSGLTGITMPDTVTDLGTYAFCDCTALTSATLSKNLKYAIDNWFGGCSALKTMTIPFVGSHKQPYRNDFDSDADYNDWMKDIVARDTYFGYIFGCEKRDTAQFNAVEQNGRTYYIPKSLTSVTVLGGTVDDDSFADCNVNVTLNDGVIDNRTAA